LPVSKKPSAETYDEQEAQRRFEDALLGALRTPHKPLKDKPKVKKAAKKTKVKKKPGK
jgi:hypothetical protein